MTLAVTVGMLGTAAVIDLSNGLHHFQPIIPLFDVRHDSLELLHIQPGSARTARAETFVQHTALRVNLFQQFGMNLDPVDDHDCLT